MGSTKITKTINEKLDSHIGDHLKVIDTRNFVKNTDRINVFCTIHECNFFPTIKNLMHSHGCPKCGLDRVKRKNTENSGYYSYEDYQNTDKFIYEEIGKNLNVNGKTIVKITCKKHDNTFSTNLLNHVNRKGGGCKKCRYEHTSLTRRSYSSLSDITKLIKNPEDYKFEYIDNRHIKVYCKIHKEWEVKKVELLKRNEELGSACTKCSKEKSGKERQFSKEEFFNLIKENGYKNKIIFDKWNGVKTKLLLNCDIHGEYEKYAGDIIYDKYKDSRNGNYCQTCNTFSTGTSFAENEMRDFISKHAKVIQSDKNILENENKRKSKEIDLLLPDYNLGIEFNGVYHHSDKIKDKNYHLEKTNLAKERGIELIHFWEFEWDNKKDIVKSIILSKLNVYDNIIYARKTEKKIVDTKIAKAFYINNHIQGFRGANKYTGLYFNNELVSCISIGSDGEVIRFCNKINHKITGGFSKLLKGSGAKYSFVDKRLFNGKSYSNTNFELKYSTVPNYFYYKNGKVFSRVKFQKHKLKKELENFDNKLTEFENMDNNGYLRIYDCGNYKFEVS